MLSIIPDEPINRIMILNKCKTSIENGIKEFLSVFYDYKSMITVIITFCDYCEYEENKLFILEKLKLYQINSVLFFSKDDKP